MSGKSKEIKYILSPVKLLLTIQAGAKKRRNHHLVTVQM